GDTLFSWGMLINIEFIRKLRHLFDTDVFDAVHGHNWEAIPATNTAAEVYDVPAFLSLHSLEGLSDWAKADAIRTIERDGIRRADAVIAATDKVASDIDTYGVAADVTVTDPADTVDVYDRFDPEVDDDHEGTDGYMGVPAE
ncbi:MAG: glycosyltransferase, partial [Candidatus Nanohaloarchaea archaeon]